MRARGNGFFAAADTTPYQPSGVILGQETEDSCVAACCRMLLLDHLPEARSDYRFSESFLRTALGTSRESAGISLIPTILRSLGLTEEYVYRRDLTIEELREYVNLHPVVTVIRAVVGETFHALIIEALEDNFIAVRDPLPVGAGSAYLVSLSLFSSRWLNLKTRRGAAVVIQK